jgi:hypothetical protein
MARPKKNPDQKISRETIVKPIIQVGDLPHELQKLEQQGEMPILKSVGVGKLDPNSRYFVSYVITTRGKEVLSIEISEPNLRAISIEEAKTEFVIKFTNDDGAM